VSSKFRVAHSLPQFGSSIYLSKHQASKSGKARSPSDVQVKLLPSLFISTVAWHPIQQGLIEQSGLSDLGQQPAGMPHERC
jgi:hypothetical protein